MSFLANIQTERRLEILGVLMLAFTLLLFLALITDEYQGSVHRPLDGLAESGNLFGTPGALIAGLLSILVGSAAHVFYFLTCVWGIMLLLHMPVDRVPTRVMGMLIITVSIAALLHMDGSFLSSETLPGGAIGAYAAGLLLPRFGIVASNIIGVTLSIVGILLATEFLFVHLFKATTVIALAVLRANVTVFIFARRAWRQYNEHVHTHRNHFKDMARTLLETTNRDNEALGSFTKGSEPIQSGAVTEELPFSGYPEEEDILDDKDSDLERIRINTPASFEAQEELSHSISLHTAPENVSDEMPFNDVPSLEDEFAGDILSDPQDDNFDLRVEERYSSDLESETPETEEEAAAFIESDPEDDASLSEEILKLSSDEIASDRITKFVPRKPLMPVRKTIEDEVIPPDYVYPRRYSKPPLSLLNAPPPSPVAEDLADKLRQTSLLLEEALETFGVQAKVTEVTQGPTITRYELEPAPGIKVSRFLSLADDLALALKAEGVRVEAPIPGKGRIGIELPNAEREPVTMRELLESRKFLKRKGKLALALGKGITGEAVAVDLASMPHLLVAGATGAGKTVCVKSLLASLLFNKTPEELQLMLIDPKMVEFSIFNDIPHLITPVVTDPKKAAASLNWLIVEMEERYRLFAQLRVRNIEVYNESVENGEIEMPEQDGMTGQSVDVVRKLPYIVCIIDELADLMMLARSEVEDAIMRLAQLARAVGIHLVIATQRPSVNVLTGVIKANFPVRISFQVSSKVDSRCILDAMGAERLIGKGDMLYLPAGCAGPMRIQGAFVGDDEMNALITHLKRQAPPQYRDEIENFGQSSESIEDLEDEIDELFNDAVRVVIETGQASISMVQRRLRVGYTRAARLIDMMELKGIVGPHTGSKAREILVDCTQVDRKAI